MRENKTMKNEIIEAYNYVSEKYRFDTASYPVIAKLNQQEIKNFSIQHLMSHITKGLHVLLCAKDPIYKDEYPTVLSKTFVNLAKLAQVLDIPIEEFVHEMQNPNLSTPIVITKAMGYIAEAVEPSEHGKPFDDTKAKKGMKVFMNLFYGMVYHDCPISYNDLLKNVPNVMKSK